MKNMEIIREMDEAPTEVHRRVLASLAPPLAKSGYQMASSTEANTVFQRTYHPGYTIFLAIIVFPIGLLFLLIKNTYLFTINVRAIEDGSIVTIKGNADNKIARQLETLGD